MDSRIVKSLLFVGLLVLARVYVEIKARRALKNIVFGVRRIGEKKLVPLKKKE